MLARVPAEQDFVFLNFVHKQNAWGKGHPGPRTFGSSRCASGYGRPWEASDSGG
jgi:hypothetical protein